VGERECKIAQLGCKEKKYKHIKKSKYPKFNSNKKLT
jgi:hypothetical protein